MRFVLGDSSRFFKDTASIFRARAEDEVDFALFHDGVGGAAHPGIGEQIVNVFQPASGLVEQILRNPIAMEATRDAHVVPVDTQLTGAIGESQRDFGKSKRFARIGAIENDVGHFLAAERFG